MYHHQLSLCVAFPTHHRTTYPIDNRFPTYFRLTVGYNFLWGEQSNDQSGTRASSPPLSTVRPSFQAHPPPHSFSTTQYSILGHGLVSASLPQASRLKCQPQNSGKTHNGRRSSRLCRPTRLTYLRDLGDDAYLPLRTTHGMMAQLNRWSTRYDVLRGLRHQVPP